MDAGFLMDHVDPDLEGAEKFSLMFGSKDSPKTTPTYSRTTVEARIVLTSSQSSHRLEDLSPINTRAWCFQESLLSRRLLSFGPTQVRWICQGMEGIDGGNAQLHMRLAVPIRDNPAICRSDFDTAGPVSRDWSWPRIVTEYCRRNLTFPSDKLIALAAVAEAFSERSITPIVYLAGIWHDKADNRVLLELLMWSTTGDNPGTSMAEYIAPSWSWASRVGQKIKYEAYEAKDSEKYSLQGVEAHCEPLDSRLPFGTAKHGQIDCSGYTQGASIAFKHDRWLLESPSTNIPFNCNLDEIPTEAPSSHHVLCLIVLWTNFEPAGLVLVKDEHGRYRRVGIWDFTYRSEQGSFKQYDDGKSNWIGACKQETLVLV